MTKDELIEIIGSLPYMNMGTSLHICRGDTWCISGIDSAQYWLMERNHDGQGTDYFFVTYLTLDDVEFIEKNYKYVIPRTDYWLIGYL